MMRIKARAKINLALDVLGTRPDGYHELETIMQTLALHDVVEITPAAEIELVVEGADLPPGPENLAFRAAELLRRRVGYRGGAGIKLTKRIPLAAGLAGGSADAAAVLRGLNEFWGLGLKLDELVALGAELGSDVPFCLRGGTALARGRGEVIYPLPDLPALGVVLVKPPFGVSTAGVYRLFDDIAGPNRPDCRGMLEAVHRGDVGGVISRLGNVLEAVTLSLHPVIGEIKKDLAAAGALGVLMSGSGPTVFGLFPEYRSAQAAAGELSNKENYTVLVTEFSGAKL
ncbi:4-(cytidine 5'-diphospho)-2-C-methyl-D-erythritol kinase [Desulfallas sp. Bu1-1]|jgi:4-diphosphocytidyl-2-C-methyl-D-erythritol kinase|uniref:4-(cytidine 5'-diphospho)-2-C-methyl-D-erythritol kinase n=1 Tax=Desulfallas sp. Bu1-1 TaxID=2787620 RepID=UPI0018A09F41|nr:4-(cytidine 5'-diphospho)-2-C-methyl-D-erythritol kinase [Desulfallas sp. Bu1-1]MBF7082674.1 4-(cytidine 5'-diphospho)-2-C-methyl-D-erythritol kinase [Desulfallas sp. Bu1-1]